MASKYDQILAGTRAHDKRRNGGDPHQEPRPITSNRYGFSESEWAALTPEERVIHYNRQGICEHKANLFDWPPDLRDSYSHDPYFHTAHMIPCQRWGIKAPQRNSIVCECQMCLLQIGIERGTEHRVNTEAVREKWRKKFNQVS